MLKTFVRRAWSYPENRYGRRENIIAQKLRTAKLVVHTALDKMKSDTVILRNTTHMAKKMD